MKLTASCTPFEFIPPPVMAAFIREVKAAASEYGLVVDFAEDLTVRDATQRFWAWQKAQSGSQDG